MRHLLIGIVFVAGLCLAVGPVAAQHPKAAHHKKHDKQDKKGKKHAKKGKKGMKRPAPKAKPSSIYAKKGTWTLSGQGWMRADFLKGEVSGKKYWTGPFNLQVASVVSYFVIDGLELRVGPSFQYFKRHVKKAPDFYGLSGGAVLGAYYNHQLAGTLFLTAGADLNLSGGKTTTENKGPENKFFDVLGGPRIGLTLALGGRYGGFFRVMGFFDYGMRKYSGKPTVPAVADQDDILNFGVQTALGLFF